MRFLVARHPDEPDTGLRNQRVRLIDHAQPGAQHRHQQRWIGQPGPDGLGQRCSHRDGFGGGVACRLVHQHQGQVAQCRTERGVVGALVAQSGQPGGGQRVVDDAHIHAPNPSGTELSTRPS